MPGRLAASPDSESPHMSRLPDGLARLVVMAAWLVGLDGVARSGPSPAPRTTPLAAEAPDTVRGTAASEWLDRTPSIARSPVRPAAGEDCAAVYDPVDHQLVLFGGKDDANHNLGEIWALDLERDRWRKI